MKDDDEIRDVRIDITALERQMAAISGISPYLLSGREDRDEFGHRPTQSGYAISIAMNAARARFFGPTYRTYRLTIAGRRLLELRRRVEAPRTKIDREYAAFVRNTYGIMSKTEAINLWGAPRPRTSWRDRAFMAYATTYALLTARPFWIGVARGFLRTAALALWIAVVTALFVLAFTVIVG